MCSVWINKLHYHDSFQLKHIGMKCSCVLWVQLHFIFPVVFHLIKTVQKFDFTLFYKLKPQQMKTSGKWKTQWHLLVLLAGSTHCRDGSFSTQYVRIFMNTRQWRRYLVQHAWHKTYAIFDSHSNYMRSSKDVHPHTHVHSGYFMWPTIFFAYVLQVAKQ
jgi:hypothetical protein